MTRTFATWLEVETASDYELKRELDRELEALADDLRICGAGYPSPRKRSIAAIAREQAKRELRLEAVLR